MGISYATQVGMVGGNQGFGLERVSCDPTISSRGRISSVVDIRRRVCVGVTVVRAWRRAAAVRNVSISSQLEKRRGDQE